DKYSELLTQDRVRVGQSEDCDLRLRRSTLPDGTGCLIELARTNGHYRVAEFDPNYRLLHNGEPLLPGAEIGDGDEVLVEDCGLSLRLFPVRDLPARRRQETYVAPFIESAALESAATPRRDDAKVFLREFSRELLREINTSTKIALFLIAAAFVGGILYLGSAANRELKRSRDLIDKQNERLAQMQGVFEQQQERQHELDKTNQGIINTLSLAPQIRSAYGGGVGLLTGSYILVERGTGRQLRYPDPGKPAADPANPAGAEELQPVLTPDGYGEPFEKEFAGTAFHVGDGYVITNRHLAVEPWRADQSAQIIGASVNAQFRLTRLVVYFPGVTQPFPLRVKNTSARDDLAVCLIEGRELPKTVPALPLDKESDAAGVGRTVVMMGYPTSEERILATLPEAESLSIQQRFGSSLGLLLQHLAERNFIRPLTTQGHITDLESQRLVYEGSSAEGASGAPLFGQSGRVIGVNFGMFTQMQNFNFAAPIRFALPLLQKSGWKRDETVPDANAAATANAPTPKDSRPVTSTNQSR
ncbi:MAG TPA: serine protease, partial [Pyrinomonadaceae bacterium]